VAAINVYKHYCQQELKEVDRHALPYVVEFMEALESWNYQKIKPYLTDQYNDSLTIEEWQSELKQLSVLGELESFARPRFVSHQPYTRFYVCESAVDLYSVASEYENENAVVRVFFENNCGNLKVKKFLVTSKLIKNTTKYLKNIDTKNDANDLEIKELMSADDKSIPEDYDMDKEFENLQEQSEQEEISLDAEIDTKTLKSEEVKTKKPKGKIYQY